VSEFRSETFEREITVRQGHSFAFPIATKRTMTTRGASTGASPKAKGSARGYFFEAHQAAREAFGQQANRRDLSLHCHRGLEIGGNGMEFVFVTCLTEQPSDCVLG
jgi:hypothetical protein